MADLEKLEQERQKAIQYLSKPWRNFFNKFKEIETLRVSLWKPIHLLAYFDKRYRELYNKNFAYTCKRAPSKCTEIVLIKQMCAMLSTTSMNTVKKYIDWVFDYKIRPKNMKIKSLAFFGTPGLGNEFYFYKKESEKITRNKELPLEYKEAAERLNMSMSTYGDLAFAKMALDKNPNRIKIKELFDKLYLEGFEVEKLKDLK